MTTELPALTVVQQDLLLLGLNWTDRSVAEIWRLCDMGLARPSRKETHHQHFKLTAAGLALAKRLHQTFQESPSWSQ